VEDLENGQKVDSIFLVRDKNLSNTKDGRPFINLNLIDRSGKVAAKVWDRPAEENYVKQVSERFNKNDFVRVRGRVETFKDAPQIIVDEVEAVPPSDVQVSDFVPKGDMNPDELVKELLKIVDKFKTPPLKKLLLSFLREKDFMDRFKIAPAAKKLHQAYIGGLIDHTTSLVKMADDIASYYPDVNRDLLVAGAFLHDIGKIEELDYERSFDYSDRGRFLGHLVIGAMMVREKIKTIDDFPRELESLLLHLILSHHGAYEFGSPVVPMIPEAVILHYLDDMDAKVWGFVSEKHKSKDTPGNWTRFSNVYERFLFKGDTFIGIDDTEKRKKRKREELFYDLFDDEEA
jgi:3'-5' exoribonuclease